MKLVTVKFFIFFLNLFHNPILVFQQLSQIQLELTEMSFKVMILLNEFLYLFLE
jgi:hypothetical protein